MNRIWTRPVMDAAMHGLRRWVAGGPPLPMQPRLELSSDRRAIVRDPDGIARGGIRLPGVDVPIAVQQRDPGDRRPGRHVERVLSPLRRRHAPGPLRRPGRVPRRRSRSRRVRRWPPACCCRATSRRSSPKRAPHGPSTAERAPSRAVPVVTTSPRAIEEWLVGAIRCRRRPNSRRVCSRRRPGRARAHGRSPPPGARCEQRRRHRHWRRGRSWHSPVRNGGDNRSAGRRSERGRAARRGRRPLRSSSTTGGSSCRQPDAGRCTAHVLGRHRSARRPPARRRRLARGRPIALRLDARHRHRVATTDRSA